MWLSAREEARHFNDWLRLRGEYLNNSVRNMRFLRRNSIAADRR